MDRPSYGENSRSSLEAVRAQCKEYVQAEFSELERQILDNELPVEDVAIAVDIIEEFADYGVMNGDEETVARCVTAVSRLPDDLESLKVGIYYMGVLMHDRAATETLAHLLEEERQEFERELVQRVNPEASIFLYGSRLMTMVDEGIKKGIDPTEWVNRFAVNSEQQVACTLQATQGLASSELLPAETRQHYQDRFEATLWQLPSANDLPLDFVSQTVAGYFKDINNPMLRRALVDDHQLRIFEAATMDWSVYKQHIRLGAEICEDHSFTPAYLTSFFNSIEGWGRTFTEAGIDEYTVRVEQFPWKMALKVHENPSPQNLVKYLDKYTHSLLSEAEAFAPTKEQEVQDMVLGRRNDFLQQCAVQAAAAGSFEEVRFFMNHLASETYQQDTLQKVLSAVRTPADIEQIKPDELTLQLNPQLNSLVAIAAARCEGDIRQVEALTGELVAAIAAEEGWQQRRDKERLLHTIYQDMGGSDNLEFARFIVNKMRAGGVDLWAGADYLHDLISHGDLGATEQTYEWVRQHIADPAERFSRLLWVANNIPATQNGDV